MTHAPTPNPDPLPSPEHVQLQVQIKICGVTHEEHIKAAAECGADLIGLVLWPGSSRHVSLDRALQLAETVRREGLESVALVVDAGPEFDAHAGHFDRVQFHGQESCERLAGCPRPTIRGFGFSPEAIDRWCTCPHVAWLLIDSPHGGSGEAFDHDAMLPHRDRITKPWFIAGGLRSESVAGVIAKLRPDGVDVSSGVERSRGVKDPELIRRFCESVRANG